MPRAADVFGGTPAAYARAFTDAGKAIPAPMKAALDAQVKARQDAARAAANPWAQTTLVRGRMMTLYGERTNPAAD